MLMASVVTFGRPWVKGIYITQPTAENSRVLRSLIKTAKQYGINTFVIDFRRSSRAYRKNIKLVKQNHLHYVARIVVFPHGGTRAQVLSKNYWQRKYRLVESALKLGAQEIQLDYIRYRSTQRASPHNAQDIYQVIKWFKQQLMARNIPLQIDIFGVASFRHALHIGHNIKLFADSVDVVCPMVYPSHYEPYRKHALIPYHTVLSSIRRLRAQFNNNPPFKIYPYIELYNYRYALSSAAKIRYIYQQLKAVEDSHADGWYVWSPTNKYGYLFAVLRSYKLR
jgi:hypothetical protein